MNPLESIKDIGHLVKRYNDDELQRKILELREDILNLSADNHALKRKCGELEEKPALRIDERYKLIMQEHHYAVEFREKIFRGQCVVYATLAAAFGWVQQSGPKSVSWVVSAVAFVAALLFWVADTRNRSAIRASKNTGAAIEKDAGIPPDQRFFAQVIPEKRWERALTHSRAIDGFAIIVILALAACTVHLWRTKGILEQPPVKLSPRQPSSPLP